MSPGAALAHARGRLAPWMLDWAAGRASALARRAARALAPGRHRGGPVHVLVALCDHFEPLWTGDPAAPGGAPLARGRERVAAWRRRYPELAASFRDADGRPPRHTFFFPGEQYHPDLVEPLGELVGLGLGEVEVHLHHDGDTRASLERSLDETLSRLGRHGLLPRRAGRPRWAFIHGNWCLANARADGRHCGVDDELDLLHELGCYADFTFPSAPDETQPRLVNAIYYPSGDVRRRRAHEVGRRVAVGTRAEQRVLIVEGPLALARRTGRAGLPVRIDAAALTATDPATPERLATWIAQGVGVAGRPDWVFVKLHTHGAPEREAASLLGNPQRRFHEALAALGRRGEHRVHYVTARELYNLARAAMDGFAGEPRDALDHEVPPPERAQPGAGGVAA